MDFNRFVIVIAMFVFCYPINDLCMTTCCAQINGKYQLSGGQPSNIFMKAFEAAAKDGAE